MAPQQTPDNGEHQATMPNRHPLRQLRDCVATLRHEDPYVTAYQIEILCVIAEDEPIRITELCNKTGIRSATVSYLLGYMSKYGSGKKGSLNWVTITQDPEDRRQRQLKLTKKGRRIADRLSDIITKGNTDAS